ncbi:hypothetical protein DFH09DRAFT_1305673 [Mycena vulgaris]|nr:hypothetical protein DFH09DRAFT_1305673 [Mycena vulgaris]
MSNLPCSPPAFTLPSDEDDVCSIPVLSATPTEEEIQAHKRRMSTLAARKSRRRKQQQQQMLGDEVLALRATVADLRAAHSALGMPPVDITSRPPRSADAYLDPIPEVIATEGDNPILWKRQQSARASWKSKRRKLQQLMLLEDEAADLKAEVAELRTVMSVQSFER